MHLLSERSWWVQFSFSNCLISWCCSSKPNLTPRLLTSSSSSPKLQLCHQLGWNICSQTRHLLCCLTSLYKQKEWYICLHNVMVTSQQWYHLLQNPQGLTFIAKSQVGGLIVRCRIGLGHVEILLPFCISITWHTIDLCSHSKPKFPFAPHWSWNLASNN
jgi:hypothetical protein